MPRLAWVTDLHLNFLSWERVGMVADALAARSPDHLLVSGDTCEANGLERYLGLLAQRVGCPVWFVLGNHDFYRGSIAGVRAVAASLKHRVPGLAWLGGEGVVSLSAETALVGCDGWADARAGDWDGSRIELNDYDLIAELSGISKDERRKRLRSLGDEAGAHLRRVLAPALASHRRAIVVMHPPPFAQACLYEGGVSPPDWLPHLACVAAGSALRGASLAWPDREILVLCGHTHGGAQLQVGPNLLVLVGEARYGMPELQRMLDLP